MIKHLLTASREGDSRVRIALVAGMLKGTGMLVLLAVSWFILSKWFFEGFSPFSYWNQSSSNIWPMIWPIALYAILMGQLAWFSNRDRLEGPLISENLLFKGLVSFYAGVVEELSHRGFYIYMALIVVFIVNMFFQWFVGFAYFVIAIFLAYFSNVLTGRGNVGKIIAILIIALSIVGWIFLQGALPSENGTHIINDHILRFYEWLASNMIVLGLASAGVSLLGSIIFWILIKIGKMGEEGKESVVPVVLHAVLFVVFVGYAFPLGIGVLREAPIIPEGADKWAALLYVGAVLYSNTKFREGHNYQGLAGSLNAYVLGFYFFYVAFGFGLIYAILVHFLYDLLLFASEHSVAIVRMRQHRV